MMTFFSRLWHSLRRKNNFVAPTDTLLVEATYNLRILCAGCGTEIVRFERVDGYPAVLRPVWIEFPSLDPDGKFADDMAVNFLIETTMYDPVTRKLNIYFRSIVVRSDIDAERFGEIVASISENGWTEAPSVITGETWQELFAKHQAHQQTQKEAEAEYEEDEEEDEEIDEEDEDEEDEDEEDEDDEYEVDDDEEDEEIDLTTDDEDDDDEEQTEQLKKE